MSLNEALYGKIFLFVIVSFEVNRVHFAQRRSVFDSGICSVHLTLRPEDIVLGTGLTCYIWLQPSLLLLRAHVEKSHS